MARKRAKRMSLDTNLVSVACLMDILKALDVELTERSHETSEKMHILLELSFIKAMINERVG